MHTYSSINTLFLHTNVLYNQITLNHFATIFLYQPILKDISIFISSISNTSSQTIYYKEGFRSLLLVLACVETTLLADLFFSTDCRGTGGFENISSCILATFSIRESNASASSIYNMWMLRWMSIRWLLKSHFYAVSHAHLLITTLTKVHKIYYSSTNESFSDHPYNTRFQKLIFWFYFSVPLQVNEPHIIWSQRYGTG